MLTELVASGLSRATLVGSFATAAVLSIRFGVSRLWGADAAWRLWRVVPIAVVASFFPGPAGWSATGLELPTAAGGSLTLPTARVFVLVWAIGATLSTLTVALQEIAFRRRASRGLAGPAVMGAFWPRLITPQDFTERFTPRQCALILAHERMHIARGDVQAAVLIVVCRVLFWFNPLAYVAATTARLDQELACDAEVLARRPTARRDYAEALLRAGVGGNEAATSCGWLSRHALEVRLRALRRAEQTCDGDTLVLMLGAPLLVALAVWVAEPTGERRAAVPQASQGQVTVGLVREAEGGVR